MTTRLLGTGRTLTPWTGETWPRRHRVVVRKDGYSDREPTVELEPLKSAEVVARYRTAF